MSVSLTQVRRALAQELGQFAVGTATGGTTTTVVSPALFASTVLEADAFANAWVFFPAGTGIRQRRITLAGLAPLTGTVTLDGILGFTPAVGATFEVHALLPASRTTDSAIETTTVIGLNEIITIALRHLLIPDRVLLSLANGIYDYGLTAWWWLDRASRLTDVLEPNVSGTTRESTWRDWSFRESASGPSLHLRQPYRFTSGSHSLELAVARPADSKIKRAGVWTDVASSAPGLLAETDEAFPDLNAIVDVALAYCYRALRDTRTGSAAERYHALFESQWAKAQRVYGFDRSVPMAETATPAPTTAPAAPAAA